MTTFPKRGKRIRTKKMADKAVDTAESAKVRERSEGRCEVRIWVMTFPAAAGHDAQMVIGRCMKRAAHVMHLIGGRGKRGRGISALKEHKLHGCAEHHREIDGDLGGKRLKRIGDSVPLWTDPYERLK